MGSKKAPRGAFFCLVIKLSGYKVIKLEDTWGREHEIHEIIETHEKGYSMKPGPQFPFVWFVSSFVWFVLKYP